MAAAADDVRDEQATAVDDVRVGADVGASPSPLQRWMPLAVVIVLALLYRVPPLLNAGAVNSDAAIVGLQARHIAHGEMALHLWGTNYQGVIDSAIAALFFAVFGASPTALMAVPVVLLVVMIVFAFDVAKRHVGAMSGAICVMPLVLAPMASNSPMVYVMRQSLATMLVIAVWLIERGHTRRRFLGGAMAALIVALYIDFFALVTIPAVVFLAALHVMDDEAKIERILFGRTGRIAAIAIGLAMVLMIATGILPAARLMSKIVLLLQTCLPFALGTKIFIKGEELVAQPWNAPAIVFVVQVMGAIAFSLSVLFAGRSARTKDIPFPIRRLGLFGFATTILTLAAFIVSSKPSDMWSSRYLAPIFWMAPFTLLPIASRLGSKRLAIAHAPYWIGALIGGWLSYGLWVDGAMPRRHASATMRDESALRSALLDAGVHHAEAQYWLAYRLTFLFDEDPIVVPLDRTEDRYPPYRARVDAATTPRAFVFHPSEPRALPGPYEVELRSKGIAFERREVAGYTILVTHSSIPAPQP